MSASKLNKKNSNNVIITRVSASVPLMKNIEEHYVGEWGPYYLPLSEIPTFSAAWWPAFLWVSAAACWFLSTLNKLGTDSNEIWPTSTLTGRADRWSTSVLLKVKTASDLSDSLSKCTVDTGDNGASNCSQTERCYLYANEEGSKNFIWKHQFASLMRDAHVANILVFIRLSVIQGRWWKHTYMSWRDHIVLLLSVTGMRTEAVNYRMLSWIVLQKRDNDDAAHDK